MSSSRVKSLVRVVRLCMLRERHAGKRSLAAGMVVAGLLAAGCASPLAYGQPTSTGARSTAARPLVGIYEPGAPASSAGLAKFTLITGIRPQIVVYYSGWHEKFWSSYAYRALHNGATPLVQLDPTRVSLNAISAGASDPYLKSFAESVKAFRHPVLMSFGHEMNGGWYPWGKGHVSPAVFVAAWRHVVQVFRNAGVSNVKWVWTVSSLNQASGPLRPWWPGSSWVNYVGIDGYYYTASATYKSVFGIMLNQMKKFSGKPVLITEVGIGPNSSRVEQIAALYAHATSDHFSGIVWFDVAQHDGPYKQNWRLEDDPAALAAFERAVHRGLFTLIVRYVNFTRNDGVPK